jgi:hypothetical protein
MFKKTTNNKKATTTNTTTTKKTNYTTKNFSTNEVRNLIEVRAYELYCKRSGRPGDQTSDWLTAEKQVTKELGLNIKMPTPW